MINPKLKQELEKEGIILENYSTNQLLKIIPKTITVPEGHPHLRIKKEKNGYRVSYGKLSYGYISFNKPLVNALAQLCLQLLDGWYIYDKETQTMQTALGYLKVLIRSAQKQVDPPLVLPHDGYLLPIKVSPAMRWL